jgi:AraC-like DNA-binding protein
MHFLREKIHTIQPPPPSQEELRAHHVLLPTLGDVETISKEAGLSASELANLFREKKSAMLALVEMLQDIVLHTIRTSHDECCERVTV